MQALFASGIILLAEKLFLQFVAINFHQKAIADRLAENRLGLKALDRLSNAQPAAVKKTPYKRGHKSFMGSFGTTLDLQKQQEKPEVNTMNKSERQRKRKKAMANVIVDQASSFNHLLNCSKFEDRSAEPLVR
jgi:hypothetical protein